jgi:ankyrin repeat protein
MKSFQEESMKLFLELGDHGRNYSHHIAIEASDTINIFTNNRESHMRNGENDEYWRAPDNYQKTALDYACLLHKPNLANQIVSTFSDRNYISSGTVLTAAIRRCRIRTITALLEEGRVLIDAQDELGATALHHACSRYYARPSNLRYRESAYPQIVNLLIAYGASINILDNEKKTPLHWLKPVDEVKISKDVNWRRRKNFALFLSGLNQNLLLPPIDATAAYLVIHIKGIQMLIGSYL